MPFPVTVESSSTRLGAMKILTRERKDRRFMYTPKLRHYDRPLLAIFLDISINYSDADLRAPRARTATFSTCQSMGDYRHPVFDVQDSVPVAIAKRFPS